MLACGRTGTEHFLQLSFTSEEVWRRTLTFHTHPLGLSNFRAKLFKEIAMGKRRNSF